MCGLPPWKIRLYVDHDHKTDLIRGLLHLQCNTAVGFIENVPQLSRLLRYIKNGGTAASKKLGKIRHARLTQKASRKAAHAKKAARLKKVATRRPRPPNVDAGLTSAEAAKFLHVTLGTLLYHDRRGTLKPRYVHRDGRLVKTYAVTELVRLYQRISRDYPRHGRLRRALSGSAMFKRDQIVRKKAVKEAAAAKTKSNAKKKKMRAKTETLS